LDYWSLYGLQVMFPLVLPSVLFFESLIIIGIKTWRRPTYLSHLRHRISAHPFEKALSIYIFLLTSLYTFIVSVALSPFRCYPQADGSYTLIPNPSQDCLMTHGRNDFLWYVWDCCRFS
jgi:hypothetical protein